MTVSLAHVDRSRSRLRLLALARVIKEGNVKTCDMGGKASKMESVGEYEIACALPRPQTPMASTTPPKMVADGMPVYRCFVA